MGDGGGTSFRWKLLTKIQVKEHPYFTTFLLALGSLSFAKFLIKTAGVFLQTLVLPGKSVGVSTMGLESLFLLTWHSWENMVLEMVLGQVGRFYFSPLRCRWTQLCHLSSCNRCFWRHWARIRTSTSQEGIQHCHRGSQHHSAEQSRCWDWYVLQVDS